MSSNEHSGSLVVRAGLAVGVGVLAVTSPGCAAPVETKIRCVVQELTLEDQAAKGGITRVLIGSYGVSGQDIRSDKVTGINKTGKAIETSMGLTMHNKDPQNHSPALGSYFGWCLTEVKQGENVNQATIEPLYSLQTLFSAKELKNKAIYKDNPSAQALIEQLTPGGKNMAAFPAEVMSPVKIPARIKDGVDSYPNGVAEVTAMQKTVSIDTDGTEHTIWVTDLKTTPLNPAR